MGFGLDVKPERRTARVPIMTSLRKPYPMFNRLVRVHPNKHPVPLIHKSDFIPDEVRLHTTLEADFSQASRESIVKRNTIWGLSSKKAVV